MALAMDSVEASSPAALGLRLLARLARFSRLLRRSGVAVSPEQTLTLARALEHLDFAGDLARRHTFRDAARAALISRREDLPAFERAFDLFWGPPRGAPPAGPRPPRAQAMAVEVGDGRGYSALEVLRRKDFATLSPAEEEAVRALMARRPLVPGRRRSRRWRGAPRGERPDSRRALRRALRWGGEPLTLAWRRRRERPRPLVVLCDVSGSMQPYARLLLAYLRALGARSDLGGRLEVFAFGTRLTRVTRELARGGADEALAAAAAAIPDWGGGTRIGACLARFHHLWARRVLGRGATVALLSDGWDRGEIDLLARELARLKRGCRRLLWLNPLLGTPGYEPRTRGMRAALPFLDAFLPAHNLASLEGPVGKELGRA